VDLRAVVQDALIAIIGNGIRLHQSTIRDVDAGIAKRREAKRND